MQTCSADGSPITLREAIAAEAANDKATKAMLAAQPDGKGDGGSTQGDDKRSTHVRLKPVQQVDSMTLTGILLNAPGGWVQTLLLRLRHKDRLALSRTSKELSSKMVQCARSVTLRLPSHERQGKPQSEEDTSHVTARQQVITEILAGCMNLKVVLQRDVEQPFPTALSGLVTELTLKVPNYRGACSQQCLTWAAMHQLHTVVFRQNASAEDVRLLCEALEAGQLPCLRTLTWWPRQYSEQGWDSECLIGQDGQHVLQRLAHAAGKQVLNLTATDLLLFHVSLFTILESVTLLRHEISEETVQKLCDHPRVRHVTISRESDEDDGCFVGCSPCIEGNHSHRTCNWETLTLMDVSPSILATLPVIGVKVIRLTSALTHIDDEDTAAIVSVKALQNVTLVCAPHDTHEKGVFSLRCMCQGHLPLLPHLQGVNTLRLSMVYPKDTSFLPGIYAQLPQTVSCIVLKRGFMSTYDVESLKINEACLWEHLPNSLTHVKLQDFLVDDFKYGFTTLKHIVTQAPPNVRRLTLVKLWRSRARRFDDVDMLLTLAPAHLTLVFQSWT